MRELTNEEKEYLLKLWENLLESEQILRGDIISESKRSDKAKFAIIDFINEEIK